MSQRVVRMTVVKCLSQQKLPGSIQVSRSCQAPSVCQSIIQVAAGSVILQQRLGDVVQFLLVGQSVAGVDVIAVCQQPLHIRSSTAGSAVQPGTQISRFDQRFGISQKFHLVTLLFLLFENVLKQTGGQRTPAFELFQVSKVCVEDDLLVQDVGPVWTIAVGF